MKKVLTICLFSLFAFLALTACGVLSEPEAASGPIEAVPLAVEEPTDVPPTEAPATEEEPMEEANPLAKEMAEEEVAEEEPIAEEPAPAEESAGGLVIYSIVPGESTVRFELDEDLRGNRITVVGQTDQVAGEVAVDFADLASTQVGTIQINARTLATDNNFRNRAIQNKILQTGANEFITFVPTAVNNLPASVAIGDSAEFSIDGDLTVAGVTNPATFDLVVTAVSADQITGTASAIILREDFGLQIPTVPDVANVEEEVELYIDFIANAQQ